MSLTSYIVLITGSLDFSSYRQYFAWSIHTESLPHEQPHTVYISLLDQLRIVNTLTEDEELHLFHSNLIQGVYAIL